MSPASAGCTMTTTKVKSRLGDSLSICDFLFVFDFLPVFSRGHIFFSTSEEKFFVSAFFFTALGPIPVFLSLFGEPLRQRRVVCCCCVFQSETCSLAEQTDRLFPSGSWSPCSRKSRELHIVSFDSDGKKQNRPNKSGHRRAPDE